MSSVNILGFRVCTNSMSDVLDFIFNQDSIHVISGNPEILMNGYRDSDLREEFLRNDTLIIPDGVGVNVASKISRQGNVKKIPGIELMDLILADCVKNKMSVFFLGGTSDVVASCANFFDKKYDGLMVSGYADGYFGDAKDKLIKNIVEKQPDVIFVAMGCPKQERLIKELRSIKSLNTRIFMGVGGSFDVFSGNKQRAPQLIISLNLEWLYRCLLEPKRFVRLAVIPKFLYNVIAGK